MLRRLLYILFTAMGVLGGTGCGNRPNAVVKERLDRINRPWNQEVIYFVVIDRFYDGDPFNNVPSGSDLALLDPAQQDVHRYHGGDLRGLEIALQMGYFNDLGVTALWINPPVRHVWYSEIEDRTGYDGYQAQDVRDIDPHWTSRFSLTGETYPVGKEGRLAHYRDFIQLAHDRGIRVIQDGVHDFKSSTGHGPDHTALEKSDGQAGLHHSYALTHLDLNPDSPHFQSLVDEFAETYRFYIRELGVDGMGIPSVSPVDHASREAFVEALLARLEPEHISSLFSFGPITPLVHPPFSQNLRNYLRVFGNGYGNFYDQAQKDRLSTALKTYRSGDNQNGEPKQKAQTQADGPRRDLKRVNYVEDHRGLNRFRAEGVSLENNVLASAMVLLVEGLPCLYYGTEAAIQAAMAIEDRSESGRMTFIPRGDLGKFDEIRAGKSFRLLSSLARLRVGYPALYRGVTSVLWEDRESIETDNGLFAFARQDREGSGQTLIVVFNAHPDRVSMTGTAGSGMPLLDEKGVPFVKQGEHLVSLPIENMDDGVKIPKVINPVWIDDVPQAKIVVPPKAVVLYEIIRKP